MSGKTARRKRREDAENARLRRIMTMCANGPEVVGVMEDDFSHGTATKGVRWSLLQTVSKAMKNAVEFFYTDDVAVALIDTEDGHTQAFVGVFPEHGTEHFRVVASFDIDETIDTNRDMRRKVKDAGGVAYIALVSGIGTNVPALHNHIIGNYAQIMSVSKSHMEYAEIKAAA